MLYRKTDVTWDIGFCPNAPNCQELLIKTSVNPKYKYKQKHYQEHFNIIASKYAENMTKLKNDKVYYSQIRNIQKENICNYDSDIIAEKYIEFINGII